MPGKGAWLQHHRALHHSTCGGVFWTHSVCLQCWTCQEELQWKHGSQGFPPKRIWVLKGDGKQGRAMSRKKGIPACLLLALRPEELSGEEQSRMQHWLPQGSPALWMCPPGLLPARTRLPSPPSALKPVVDVLTSCVLPAGHILIEGRGRIQAMWAVTRARSFPVSPHSIAVPSGKRQRGCEAGVEHVKGRALLPIKLQIVSQEIAFLTWSCSLQAFSWDLCRCLVVAFSMGQTW